MIKEDLDRLLAGQAGTRIPWDVVPSAVRRCIEDRLQAVVVRAVSAERGSSPALAARLVLADSRRVFVKAIGPDTQSGAPGGQELYRREARISEALPEGTPAPRLQMHWEAEGWVVLIYDDVDGRPPRYPWQDEEFTRVLDAMTGLSQGLTPAPLDAPPAHLRFWPATHWAQLAAQPTLLDHINGVDPWVRDNLERLAGLVVGWEQAASGASLVHSDLRADNILLTEHGVVFTDWPHATIGAPWLDLLYLLPSVAMQGGPKPDQVFWRHSLSANVDRDMVVTALAVFAGFMLYQATQPPLPGLPTLRRFQLAQAVEATRWLHQLIT